MVEIFVYVSLGAVTGLLAGMFGIGGGSILVPSLIFIFYGMGFDGSIIVLLAIGTSLASIFFSAVSSAISHHSKGSVEWPLVLPLSAGMVLGALIGAGYAASLSSDSLKLIITIFLMVVGVEMITGYSQTLANKGKGFINLSKFVSPFHGGWIGFLSSIIGIGGGSFTTPLMIAGGYNIRKGIGTAAACGVPIAAAGAMGYMYYGQTDTNLPIGTLGYIFWPAVLCISLASIFTAKIGANISHSIPEKTLKISFGIFLIIVGIMVIVN
ncbi:MAG: sulfite exporter TauE/SafE family protein [SAR86 cluster bacterium]|nr:sulfite exporter TauE/SafE family protein [SAR86 cluster bacterium]